MKKAAPQYQQSSPSQGQSITASASPTELLGKAPTKIARALVYFRHFGDLNRFEAELLGDHCLNSTVAKLANQYGLEFQRQSEKVPNRWDTPCDVTRYHLLASQYERADKVLARLFSRSKGAA